MEVFAHLIHGNAWSLPIANGIQQILQNAFELYNSLPLCLCIIILFLQFKLLVLQLHQSILAEVFSSDVRFQVILRSIFNFDHFA